jgi:hypothetical protein
MKTKHEKKTKHVLNSHTPGPWTLRTDGKGFYWVDKDDGHGGFSICNIGFRNAKANATLIWQAPMLLKYLRDVVDQADAQFKAGGRYAVFNLQTIETIRQAVAEVLDDTE